MASLAAGVAFCLRSASRAASLLRLLHEGRRADGLLALAVPGAELVAVVSGTGAGPALRVQICNKEPIAVPDALLLVVGDDPPGCVVPLALGELLSGAPLACVSLLALCLVP